VLDAAGRASKLAGDGNAVFKQGSRGVHVAQTAAGDADAVELLCHVVPIVEVAPDGEAALEQRKCRVVFALLLQQHAEPVRCVGQRCAGIIGGQLDCPLKPAPAPRCMTVLVPERGQRLDQPQAGRCPLTGACCISGVRIQRPAQGGAEIVVLGLETIQPRQVRGALQLAVRPFGQPRVELGMPAPGGLEVTGPLEALKSEFSNRLEHAHTRLTVGALGHRDQADVEQLGDRLQRIGSRTLICHGHRRERIEVAASGEHAQPPEHLCQVGGQ
jgi:hypothetical protein